MNYPNCFLDEKEFEEWLDLATESGLPEPRTNYCFDCTPAFKEYAESLNLCDRPRTFFVNHVDEDGEAILFGVSIV